VWRVSSKDRRFKCFVRSESESVSERNRGLTLGSFLHHITDDRPGPGQAERTRRKSLGTLWAYRAGFPAMGERCCLHRFQQAHHDGSQGAGKPDATQAISAGFCDLCERSRCWGWALIGRRAASLETRCGRTRLDALGLVYIPKAHPKYTPGSNRKALLLARYGDSSSFACGGFLLGLRHHRYAHVR
jgi:hypothetical protein